MSTRHPVCLIAGDGIGPEVMQATRAVLEASGAPLDYSEAVAGEAVFAKGDMTGVPKETLAAVEKARTVLKGPLGTPVGGGGKSANVTLRKAFETYANVRPVRNLPGVETPYSNRPINMVIVRENIEDLYAGIEHMQTPNVAQCLKLISRQGSEKAARLAFALARAEGRKKVTCVTKSNIMKLSEGMMMRVTEEVAKHFPDIAHDHIIVDACAHDLVVKPEKFDVLVTTNLNGDILSDLAAGLVGGLGLAASANIGDQIAIFEAVHGTAPDIAGQNKANPSALLQAAVMMLRHLGEGLAATRIERALLQTLAAGKVRTGDLARGGPAASTDQFAAAIIETMGTIKIDPATLPPPARFLVPPTPAAARTVPAQRRVVGFDLFLESEKHPREFGPTLERLAEGTPFSLKMISNRGTQVYPEKGFATECVDQSRGRFVLRDAGGDTRDSDILALVARVAEAGLRWAHIEKLQEFDGQKAYTLAQGEG